MAVQNYNGPAAPGQQPAATSFSMGTIYGYSEDENTIPVNVSWAQPIGRQLDGSQGQGTGDVDRGIGMGQPVDPQISTVTLGQAMQQYAQMASSNSPEDRARFAAIQQKLLGAGLLTKGKFIPGLPDDATMGALHQTLIMSSRTSQSLEDTLAQASITPLSNKPPKLVNDENLKASVQSIARQLLGGRADDNLVSQITQNYQSQMEDELANGTYDTSQAVNPNAAWLEEQIRTLRPQTVQAQQTGNNIGSFLKMIDTQGLFSAYHR